MVCGLSIFYPVSLDELRPGKRAEDLEFVESTINPPPATSVNLNFILRFEKPVNLTKEPVFRILGSCDEVLGEKSGLEDIEVQSSSLYKVYVCRIPMSSPGARVLAQWRPR